MNQFYWSDEDINEYSKTGFYPVFSKELIKIFDEIVHNISKLNSKLSLFTEYWLNSKQINIFLSIYSIVTSRTFRINLADFNTNDKGKNYRDNLILSRTGGTVLIPFIDLCNHYHPNKETSISKADSKSYKIKRLKNFSKISKQAH